MRSLSFSAFGCLAVASGLFFAAAAHAADSKKLWVYAYPAYSHISFSQTTATQAPLTFTASTGRSLGLRGGATFGQWAVQAEFFAFRFLLDSNANDTQSKDEQSGSQLHLNVLRSLFSNFTKLKLNGYALAGLQNHTVPVIGPGISNPQLASATDLGAEIGFVISSYVSDRTRITLQAKFLPSLSQNHNLITPITLKGASSFDFSLGAQYLFKSNFILGATAAYMMHNLNATISELDGSISEASISNKMASGQVQVGYQF
jgi:hypothetical protein